MPTRRRKLGRWLIVATLAGAGTFVGVGSIRTATSPAAGTSIHGLLSPPATLPATFTVASFNIHSGQPERGGENLDTTAKTLEGFDFAGLMEVRGRGALQAQDQAQRLGEKLDTGWLYLPTENQYWHEAFGNAVLTRLAVKSWERRPLPSPAGSSRRNVAIVRVGDRLTVLVTHIARNEDQPEQLKMLAQLFLEQPEPAILMGDLNVTSENPAIAGLLAHPGVRSPLDEKMSDYRGKHIDWIFTRGLDVIDAGTRDLKASDHPLVWAKLRLAEPTTRP